MNDFMEQIFKWLGNNGLSDISQKGKKDQYNKNSGARHMSPDERLQKLLKQIIGEIEKDVYDISGDADGSHIQ